MTSSAKTLSRKTVALMLLSLSLCACAHTTTHQPAPLSGAAAPAPAQAKAVARVNGTDITLAELQRAQKILLANKPGLSIPPTLEKEFEKQTLSQLISSELLFQASSKLQIKDLDQQVEAKLVETRQRFADPAGYLKGLQNIGMDERAFRASVRRDLSIAYLVNTSIAKDVAVSGDEVKKFYDENPDKFRLEEQVRASHLLIGVPTGATAQQKQEARDKAEQLRQRLAAGGDFAQLARENSTCPSSKQGGDLGFFGKGRMDPAFEQAAFALEPGGLSQVVETRFGYHVIKLAERKKGSTVPLADAGKKIEEFLKAQKVKAAVDLFVGNARSHAKIEELL